MMIAPLQNPLPSNPMGLPSCKAKEVMWILVQRLKLGVYKYRLQNSMRLGTTLLKIY